MEPITSDHVRTSPINNGLNKTLPLCYNPAAYIIASHSKSHISQSVALDECLSNMQLLAGSVLGTLEKYILSQDQQ